MEEKQRDNEEYIARRNAQISELEEEREELKAKLINISTKLETMERTLMKKKEDIARKNSEMSELETLMHKFEWKDDGKPTILVLGGYKSHKIHLLNRDRTRWSTLSLKLLTSLYSGGAVYLDGEIYIFGGGESAKGTFKLNREMKWIQLADMNVNRWGISNSSVAFDGCIWVFGGRTHDFPLNSVEKYKPEENKWIQMPSMEQIRDEAAAAACNGKLFVSGGKDDMHWSFMIPYIPGSIECFDPASQKWTMFLDLPSPTSGHATDLRRNLSHCTRRKCREEFFFQRGKVCLENKS